MRHLHILQPYIPKYRVPFFELLRSALSEEGVDLRVFSGAPGGGNEERGDEAVSMPWASGIDQRILEWHGRSLTIPRVPSEFYRADAVILGLVGTLVPAYSATIRRSLKGLRVGYWGHVRPYVSPPSKIDLAAERFLMHRADQVFAYTPGGAEFARLAGVPEAQVTTVMNAVDVSFASQTTSQQEVDAFRSENRLTTDSRVMAFIGGLDTSKRIGFLAASLDYLWTLDPGVVVLVAGQGRDRGLLDRAVTRGQVRLLGFADDQTKALIGQVATVILMPGRIGLIACDAMAMGIPIASTTWPYHAPEAEYLVAGRSAFFSDDDPKAYAEMLNAETFARHELRPPTVEAMVGNFYGGVLRLLGSAP